MSLASDIYGKAKKGAEYVSVKAADVTKISKAGIEIIAKESQVTDKYVQIGKLSYLAATKGVSYDEEIANIVLDITEALRYCDERREAINDIKKVKTCANCSAQNASDNTYCGKCGGAV